MQMGKLREFARRAEMMITVNVNKIMEHHVGEIFFVSTPNLALFMCIEPRFIVLKIPNLPSRANYSMRNCLNASPISPFESEHNSSLLYLKVFLGLRKLSILG